MIESFKCKETKKIWNKQRSKKFPQNIQQRVLEKMQRIDSAEKLEDFYFPPSNHFEALTGIGKDNIASELTNNGDFVLTLMGISRIWNLWIIIKEKL